MQSFEKIENWRLTDKSILVLGDCLEAMRLMPDNSVDSIVTDPPYGISFLSERWDIDVPRVEIWEEAFRVLKPGGHLLAFAGTRTQHRMATRIEDAGFNIRDMIAWAYSSGMPKSLDVSKAMDKQRHNRKDILKVTTWMKQARIEAGLTNRDIDNAFGTNGMAGHWTTQGSQPAIPPSEYIEPLLAMLGYSEKPVPEDIRKLIEDENGNRGEKNQAWEKREVVGQAIANVTAGGGLAMPGQGKGKHRIDITAAHTEDAQKWVGWGTAIKPAMEPITVARKPFVGTVVDNVREYGTAAFNIDAGRHSGGKYPSNVLTDGSGFFGKAERFFYSPKITPADRGEGNTHPTVKPTALMEYLVRLVTPPGGTVLDPFTGSGSTGKAAERAGFKFVGAELCPNFYGIAAGRIAGACV